MVPNQAFLYKITKENLGNPTIAKGAITNSNGIAWNKANNKMYYIDTPTLKVLEFDYDLETGSVSSKNSISIVLRRNRSDSRKYLQKRTEPHSM